MAFGGSTPASANEVLPGIGRAEERAIPDTVRILMPLAIDLLRFFVPLQGRGKRSLVDTGQNSYII